MRTLIIATACVALAACSREEATPAVEATETAAITASAAPGPLAADGKSTVGKFRITTADGQVMEEDVRADGTYTSTTEGKVVESGKWVQKDPATFCYTKDENGAKEVCNTEGVKDGVWSSTNPEGRTATVVRLES